MGQTQGVFTESELQDYKELTFLTKKEILHVYKRFKAMAGTPDKSAKISKDQLARLPELKVNPFRDRICKIFCSSEDGFMSFEDCLDMLSVLCDNAPRNVKTEYAFKIFDFDEDDMLGRNDIREIIVRLTRNKLSEDNVQRVIDHILQEADLDEDGFLAYAEFEHVISKSPDFLNSFTIKL